MKRCRKYAGLILTVSAAGTLAASPLNVLLITTDDQGLQAGCYGDPLAITPNMDRLAAEGMVFDNAYVTQASCSSSRSSILTGLYPHQNGQIGLSGSRPEYALKPGIQTLPFLLKSAGYHNGIIGKLHVSAAPEQFPFDYEWALMNPLLTRDVRTVADKVAEFLAEAGDAPFFLYVNYFDPHRPYNAEANRFMGLPEKPYTADDVEPFGFIGDAATLSDVAAYYNCVNRMDVGLGLLFQSLEKAGFSENTLIVFLGDNGPDFTRAKVTSYEAGVNVPFLVRWPGAGRRGSRSGAFVSAVDIVPTILDAVGVDCPPVAGRSLREVIQGHVPADWRREVFAEYTSHAKMHFYPRRSLREGSFKVIHNLDFHRSNPIPRRGTGHIAELEDFSMKAVFEIEANPPEWELYNLDMDPYEIVNLAGNPEYAAVLNQLQAALQELQKKLLDPLLDPVELARLRKLHGVKPAGGAGP